MNPEESKQQTNPPVEEQESEQQEPQPQPKAPKVDGVDSDALLGKLKKRIGKEQSEKNQYKDENDRLKARIKELEGNKKSVKELSDDDKSKDALAAKDQQIQDLKNQLSHNKAIKDTLAVFQDSGFNPSDEIVEMVVTGDDEHTYANTKAILDLIADVQEKTKQGMLKGKTPRVNGQPSVTKDDIMKIKDPLERQKAIAKHLELFNY